MIVTHRISRKIALLGVATLLVDCSENSAPTEPVPSALSFTSVVAGGWNSCGLTATETYCWGHLVGNGTEDRSPVPVKVLGGYTFSAIASGGGLTCALATGGEPYCWGSWADGFEADGLVPIRVPGGHEFVAISANRDVLGPPSACGLTATHAVYCWGNNYSGQLGKGDFDGSIECNGWGCEATPVKVGKEYGSDKEIAFKSVSNGMNHTCGLGVDGNAYCWGNGGAGQLGNGTSEYKYALPLKVKGGLTFTTLSAGASKTCGLTAAGAAYCWGANYQGTLGVGTDGDSINPVNGAAYRGTPAPVLGGLTFTAITVGRHICGLATGGSAYCWGSNQFAALGVDNNAGLSDCHPHADHVELCSLVPVAVSGGLTFAQLNASGNAHTCGLTTEGMAYCWGAKRAYAYSDGRENDGELGTGDYAGRAIPTKVAGQR